MGALSSYTRAEVTAYEDEDTSGPPRISQNSPTVSPKSFEKSEAVGKTLRVVLADEIY